VYEKILLNFLEMSFLLNLGILSTWALYARYPMQSSDNQANAQVAVTNTRNRQVAEKWGEMKYSPGEFPDEIIRLLDQYLKIRWIQLNVTSVTLQSTDQDYDHLFPVQVPKICFPAAVISQEAQPIYQKELIEKYLINI